ncbi:MAG: glutathione S-transferase family protein, partial [Alphaproteobacteria bacterium]
INPRGVVPALVLDDGTVIDESVAICRYFEEIQPEPNLMGRTAKEKAVIESWQRHMEFDGLFSVALVFRNSEPRFKDRAHPGVLGQVPQIPELAERGRIMTGRFLDALDSRLGAVPFIAGERFTIADITGFCTLEMTKWVQLFPSETHPNIRRWHGAIAERPSAQA